MNISSELTKAVVEAIKVLYDAEIDAQQVQLQKTKREFEGHLTLVVFPFLRISKKRPEETAEEIGAYLQEKTQLIVAYNVVKGFLNLVIAPSVWITMLNDISREENYGYNGGIFLAKYE